jgi:hypothetical protein
MNNNFYYDCDCDYEQEKIYYNYINFIKESSYKEPSYKEPSYKDLLIMDTKFNKKKSWIYILFNCFEKKHIQCIYCLSAYANNKSCNCKK